MLPQQAQTGDSPDETAVRAERDELLRRAVDDLPARQRMALVLKHFEGMSYDDIAGVMECSPGAVDSLLSRARSTLRETLKDML